MSDPDELVLATQQLAAKVDRLAASLTVVDEQAKDARATARRTRQLTGAVFAFALLIALGGLVSWNTAQKAEDAIVATKADAVTNCQNANRTREAQTRLWTFMLTASMQRRPDATEADKADVQAFLTWITQLFAQRDCSDLSKKYSLPDPPVLSR